MSRNAIAQETAVAAGAAKAFGRLLGSGFRHVDADVYRRRIEACRACEHCVPPPDTLLHALAKPAGEAKVCNVCGCFIFGKARYRSEHCPAPSATDPGSNRWGEPIS